MFVYYGNPVRANKGGILGITWEQHFTGTADEARTKSLELSEQLGQTIFVYQLVEVVPLGANNPDWQRFEREHREADGEPWPIINEMDRLRALNVGVNDDINIEP